MECSASLGRGCPQPLKIVLLLLPAALPVWGCGGEMPKPQPAAPPEVTVARPIVQQVADYSDQSGRTEAIDTVDLRARVKGFLKEVRFTAGQMVRKGDVLMTIEREPFEAELAAAEAKKQQTEAQVKLTEANLSRARELVKNKTISLEEYQTKFAERDAAVAQLAADEAAIEQAKINLNYTQVASPIGGRISRNYVDPGNLVGADGNTLLATVVAMDPMYVYFDVSEKVVLDLLRWRREHGGSAAAGSPERASDGSGSSDGNSVPEGEGPTNQPREDAQRGPDPIAYLQLQGENDFPHEGRLDYLENRVDPTTGTAMVRGVFPNPNGLLYPGVFATVRVPGRKIPEAVLIEEQAIGTDLDGKYVLVVGKDNVVEQRSVALGGKFGQMRLVESGLKPDELYVVIGVQKARPGLPVKPVRRKGEE